MAEEVEGVSGGVNELYQNLCVVCTRHIEFYTMQERESLALRVFRKLLCCAEPIIYIPASALGLARVHYILYIAYNFLVTILKQPLQFQPAPQKKKSPVRTEKL